jgi:hypothetical protein
MVAPNNRRPQKSTPAWHKSFLRMLPKIVSYVRKFWNANESRQVQRQHT